DRDRSGAPCRGEPTRRRDVLEAPLAEVVEEPDAPVRADDHEICPAVAIEVAERDVAAGSSGEAHLGGQLTERAVEVVAVCARPGARREDEIEIAVVVEIHEQRSDRGGGGGVRAGGGGGSRRVANPAPPPASGERRGPGG